MQVAVSDLEKIWDALDAAHTFLARRDEMNASVHMAKTVRYSPLTTTVESTKERVDQLLEKR